MVIATQLASQAVNTNVSLINKFEKKTHNARTKERSPNRIVLRKKRWPVQPNPARPSHERKYTWYHLCLLYVELSIPLKLFSGGKKRENLHLYKKIKKGKDWDQVVPGTHP